MTEFLVRRFVKNREDIRDPQVRRQYGMLSSITGIILNLLLFLSKFVVGTLFGSVSIVADAVNNLSDAGSQIISMISFRISAKPADREHPFGHARIEYVASMIVSFLILLIGLELLRESLRKIFSPELPERSWITVGVLLLSILVKLWLCIFNRVLAKRIDSAIMRATAADSLSDVLSTSAVLLTTLLLLLFPSLTVNLDAYMGVIVAILILVAGIRILNDTKNSILGEAPSEDTVRMIHDLVAEYPDALGIHDLTVHNYGPGHTIAALHIEVDGSRDIFLSHDMIDTIEQRLRRECGIEATIHMDPIVTDDREVNALRERVSQIVREIDPAVRIHDFRFVRGITHSNLIFDVAVPFELSLSEEEIKERVSDLVSRIDPAYFAVITVDRE
ncbi:MAG: cation transporter [Clostridia bacterium]|nr:cation transporter [Clostridia bacterium]MBQ1963002.1 cation transporter [Clostridia bacterium]